MSFLLLQEFFQILMRRAPDLTRRVSNDLDLRLG